MNPDAEFADFAAARALRSNGGLIRIAQEGPGPLEEDASRVRQGHAAARALEK